jgi:hypothetical protein
MTNPYANIIKTVDESRRIFGGGRLTQFEHDADRIRKIMFEYFIYFNLRRAGKIQAPWSCFCSTVVLMFKDTDV